MTLIEVKNTKISDLNHPSECTAQYIKNHLTFNAETFIDTPGLVYLINEFSSKLDRANLTENDDISCNINTEYI